MAKVRYFIHEMQPVTIHVYYCVVILPCRVPEIDKLRFSIADQTLSSLREGAATPD